MLRELLSVMPFHRHEIAVKLSSSTYRIQDTQGLNSAEKTAVVLLKTSPIKVFYLISEPLVTAVKLTQILTHSHASYLNTQGLNNSCLKSPASTLVDLTFQTRALRSFSLNQLRNLSL